MKSKNFKIYSKKTSKKNKIFYLHYITDVTTIATTIFRNVFFWVY